MDLSSKENMLLKLKGSGSHGRWAVDAIAELEGINAELEKASSYSLLKQNEKLKTENARLLRIIHSDEFLDCGWMHGSDFQKKIKAMEAGVG